jgi:hypothetical protein
LSRVASNGWAEWVGAAGELAVVEQVELWLSRGTEWAWGSRVASSG